MGEINVSECLPKLVGVLLLSSFLFFLQVTNRLKVVRNFGGGGNNT